MTYVLIVEDDDELRELVAEWFVTAGYRVATAEGGHEALVMMRAAAPSFVVMDLMMPRMNGYQLAEEMDKDPHLRSIPFCVVTASEFQPRPKTAARIFRKPFSVADLLAFVETYVKP